MIVKAHTLFTLNCLCTLSGPYEVDLEYFLDCELEQLICANGFSYTHMFKENQVRKKTFNSSDKPWLHQGHLCI